MERIKVSICCQVFNHEKYLRQCLESLVSQQTEFRYEIIVHDDASTDSSPMIIKEYKEKYPDLFKIILQKENQYSKGIEISREIMPLYIEGEYVAICEGDDFWTDLKKLQKQVDALEANQDCHMCVHGTEEIFENGEKTGTYYPAKEIRRETGSISSYDFLTMGKNYSFHTTSYMFIAKEWLQYMQNPPKFKEVCDVGDEAYMLYFGQLGNVYYINEDMSCYRRGASSSWSSIQAESFDKQIEHYEIMVRTIEEFDKYTSGKYQEICEIRIGNYLKYIYLVTGKCRNFLTKENRRYFNRFQILHKGILIVAMVFPEVAKNKYRKHVLESYKKNGYL